MAMCCMPSPLYLSRYSWIWPALSRPSSLIRMRILPQGLVIDVEVAQFAEVEQPVVEVGPFVHPAPVHVVRQVVDIAQAMAPGVQGFGGADAGQGLEVDVEKG